jgi:hypothetical protein
MPTSYTSNKKIGGLDAASSVTGTDNLVIEKSGDTLRATVNQLVAEVFANKTSGGTPANGDIVVIRRGADVRQLATENLIPDGAITNAKVSGSAAIVDTKLATISTGGKVSGTAITSGNISTSGNFTTSGNIATTGSGTLAVAGNATVAGTLGVTGVLTATGGVSGSITGNAGTATKLSSVRNFTLTGDVTGTVSSDLTSGASIPATIANDSVTFAKMQNSAAAGLSVVGRSAASAGDFAEIAATGSSGAVLRESGNAIGFGTIATTGIANNAIDNTKIRDSAAYSVIGRSSGTSGDPADITAADGQVLRRSGSSLGFGQVAEAGIADKAVGDAKLRDSSALSVIGRSASTGGVPADIAASTDGHVLRLASNVLGFGQVTTAGIADSAVENAKIASGVDASKLTTGTLPIARIADDAVTFAKIQNSAAAGSSVIGRSAASAGDFAEISTSTDGHVLRRAGGALGFGTLANSSTTATSANTANAIVARDASGNFSAGTITASVNGNAGTATKLSSARTLALTGDVTGTVSSDLTSGASIATTIGGGKVTLANLVSAVQQALVPAGAVQAFAMNSAPSGWLACNGAAVSRSTYAALFAAISTTYGAGNGTTTFNVPDLRGYFVRGSGTNSDGTASGTFGVKQADALKSHTHTASSNTTGAHGHFQSISTVGFGGTGFGMGGDAGYNGASAANLATQSAGDHSHTITVNATGDTETRPKNIAMLYCIKF